MTTDQLRAYLDACGVPGVSGLTPATWVAVELTGGHASIALVTKVRSVVCIGGIVPGHEVLRHAPLPDPNEILALRARVAELEQNRREESGSSFRVGQVWESPTALTYRIVGIQPSERLNPTRISMRQGADGSGRLFVKRGESTFGWRLVTP